ncbi:MAG: DUF2177 family protein [Rhodoferax sp.]|nr:DUF2177 family protein [Rhodoferax sp.]
MNKYAAGYIAAAVVMLAIDMVWLGVVAKPMYQKGIGHLMAEQPMLGAAIAFYLIYPLGLIVFAVAPQGADPAWGKTILMGALFGFFAYATYDLTNLATLKNWPISLAVIDIAWGSAISAVSAAAAKAAWNWAAKA